MFSKQCSDLAAKLMSTICAINTLLHKIAPWSAGGQCDTEIGVLD